MNSAACLPLLLASQLAATPDARGAALAPLDPLVPDLQTLYRELHRSPELSSHEEKTSAQMAARLRALGFEVTERVGGYGVVGVLRNGQGPTVLLRTDMDGLPVEERTGFPYASAATALDDQGREVPVMHACGHDLHMTAWIGAATLLSRAKAQWRGTLLLVGQPAEETGLGAAAMLKDGLFARFGKPDFALAVHDTPDLAAGKVGWTAGPALASVDSVDVTFFGRGGHGAYPHRTVDPSSSARASSPPCRPPWRARTTRSTRRSSRWAPSTRGPSTTAARTGRTTIQDSSLRVSRKGKAGSRRARQAISTRRARQSLEPIRLGRLRGLPWVAGGVAMAMPRREDGRNRRWPALGARARRWRGRCTPRRPGRVRFDDGVDPSYPD